MRFVFLICVVFLFCMPTWAADPMPPYYSVKADMDKAIHQQMQAKGFIADDRVDWLVGRVKTVYPKLGNVYVVHGDDVSLSPSDIYIGSNVVGKVTNGALTGIILCAMNVVQDGGIEKRYDKIAQTVNAFAAGARNTPGSQENVSLLQGIATKVFDVMDVDALKNADVFACQSLPSFGYPATEYTDLLRSQSGNGGLAKLMSNLPNRIAALDKLGPWPDVKEAAPKSRQDEANQKLQKELKFTDRITEVDPTPFLPALEGKAVEGYCYGKIKPDILLFFNRTGKVVKPRKPGILAMVLDESKMNGHEEMTYYVDDGKKNMTTEAIVLIRNMDETKTICALARIGTEMGVANIPKEFQDIRIVPPETHGDWPYKKYLAIRMKMDLLEKGETQFQINTFVFKKVGDEAYQFTTNDYSKRPWCAITAYYLLR